MIIPKKKSPVWLLVLVILFAVNMAAMTGSRLVLGYSPDMNVAVEYASISLIFSLIACAGFFGLAWFSVIAILADIIAIVYMYYILLFSNAAGWKDLTSILSYMFILFFGVIAAAVVQGAVLAVKRQRKNKNS